MKVLKIFKTKKFIHASLCLGALAAVLIWAMVLLQFKIQSVFASGLDFEFAGKSYVVPAESIGLSNNSADFIFKTIAGKSVFNSTMLNQQISELADKANIPAQNFGVAFSGNSAELNLQSSPGTAIDQTATFQTASRNLKTLNSKINASSQTVQPTVSSAGAEIALQQVNKIISGGGLYINDSEGDTIPVPFNMLLPWIDQVPDGNNIDIKFDLSQIEKSINPLVSQLDLPEKDLDFSMNGNTVTDFQAPQDGTAVDLQKAAVEMATILQNRISDSKTDTLKKDNTILLTVNDVKAGVSSNAKAYGIIQLIGTATTPFTGSTKNRIINIKTGAAKLNGTLVAPNENFSTVGTLGEIDQSTGYVPELVILGPSTVPAYGGGLCQISTTLFRAILNAALPVTERQSHSYRVSYYEKDGNGKYIGPGLDATIYDPQPDLRFLNDTGNNILITDQIIGTKITFNLYGTSDGRTSQIIGPKILSETAPPPAESLQNQNLKAGSTFQTEFAIEGATTTATYIIHYADGTTKTQVFNSVYQAMPAIYQVSGGN